MLLVEMPSAAIPNTRHPIYRLPIVGEPVNLFNSWLNTIMEAPTTDIRNPHNFAWYTTPKTEISLVERPQQL